MRFPGTIVRLMGNHEDLMLRATEDPDPAGEAMEVWLTNGGDRTLRSYGLDPRRASTDEVERWPEQISSMHWAMTEAMGIECDWRPWIFVHAGLEPPGFVWNGGDEEYDARLWIREPFLRSAHVWRGRVVYGHTPTPHDRPLIEANKIGIDCGAGKGGDLCCARLWQDGGVDGFWLSDGMAVKDLSP